MTRFLYRSGGSAPSSIELRRMSDTQLETIAHYLQQAYANQLNSNGTGAFMIGGSGAGSATDTRRTAMTSSGNNIPGVQASDFPGTGTITVSTQNYSFNTTVLPTPSSANAPLYWNGSALQRSNSTSLGTELFPLVRSRILTGNELGSFRIQANSPGTGWVNRGTAFTDMIYVGVTQQSYILWLKTGGVTAPSGNPGPFYWNDSVTDSEHMREHSEPNSTTHALISFLLPIFSNWAVSNGLRYTVSTSNIGTNKGSFVNTHRSGTNNQMFAPDFYVSTPVGNAMTVTTYYFYAS